LSAGLTLNKAFCENYYTTADKMDARYECYDLIDAKDDKGQPLTKGRTYCELKNPTQYINKYNCIEDLECLKKGAAGTSEFQ
jgi:hypothetical protein